MTDRPIIGFDEKFLETFLNLPSVSGAEELAQKALRTYLTPYVDGIRTDLMGNLITVKNSAGCPRILLAGHCDEVGLLVKYISDKGFIHFHAIGMDDHILPGAWVKILTTQGEIHGVIGKKAIHLQEPEERTKVMKLEDMYIDIGARSREEVQNLGIAIGDPVIFDVYYQRLGTNNDAVSRCFDDKIGAFIVAEVMKHLHPESIPAAVYGVSTTQEEVGSRGAITSAFDIQPHVAIVYDVDFAMDTPDSDEKKHGRVKLGGGPIISRGPDFNPKLFNLLVQTAKEMEMQIQIIAEPRAGGTDAAEIQISRAGVATVLIGIPIRYMHTYVESVNLQDVEDCIQLTVAVIKKITSETSFIPM